MADKKRLMKFAGADWPIIRETSKWIPVSERLPEHGDVVLICTKDKDVQAFQWDAVYNGWVGDRYNYSTKYVTHWMPLPEPPKGE